jgi:hypothetical protein
VQVKVVREDLDDDLHQVFLRNDVFTVDHLLEDTGKDEFAIRLQVDPLELRQADEVGADEDAEVFALDLALLAIPRVTRVL